MELPKAEEGGKKLKRNTLLEVEGPEIRDKLKTLTGTGDDYDTAVQSWKKTCWQMNHWYFSFHKHLIALKEKEKDLMTFALRVRKVHRRIEWDAVKQKQHDLTNLMPILSLV